MSSSNDWSKALALRIEAALFNRAALHSGVDPEFSPRCAGIQKHILSFLNTNPLPELQFHVGQRIILSKKVPKDGEYSGFLMEQEGERYLVGITKDHHSSEIIDGCWVTRDEITLLGHFSIAEKKFARDRAGE